MNLFSMVLSGTIIFFSIFIEAPALAAKPPITLIKQQFDRGKPLTKIPNINQCFLYGSFTGAKVMAKNPLYDLEQKSKTQLFNRSPFHIFQSYSLNGEWISKTKQGTEVLRTGDQGQLIAEISIFSPQKAKKFPSSLLKDHLILSYIVCN